MNDFKLKLCINKKDKIEQKLVSKINTFALLILDKTLTMSLLHGNTQFSIQPVMLLLWSKGDNQYK